MLNIILFKSNWRFKPLIDGKSHLTVDITKKNSQSTALELREIEKVLSLGNRYNMSYSNQLPTASIHLYLK